MYVDKVVEREVVVEVPIEKTRTIEVAHSPEAWSPCPSTMNPVPRSNPSRSKRLGCAITTASVLTIV